MVKSNYDKKIQNKLLNLFAVREADVVLTYVSTPIEVKTLDFISALLEQGKKVAVPKCLNDKGDMDFFLINSLDDLEDGFFGVREPDPETSEKGQVITGMEQAEAKGTIVFHAGTKETDGNIVTNGGRVLAVSALGEDIASAIAKAYEGVKEINFANMQYRTDIGKKALM
jgi:hypothetical protein